MNKLRSYITKEPSLHRGRFFCFSATCERGNALLYVLMAVGLLAALTYAYVQDSKGSYASQSSVQIAETLYSQVNMIKSAISECAAEYPGGGEDATSSINGVANANPNMPYPLNPSSPLSPKLTPGGCTTSGSAAGCISTAVDNSVIYLACPGAPAGAAYIFSGTSNQGRFLPPPPNGFSAWTYGNDATGVYIQITNPTCDASCSIALQRLLAQFTSGTQATLTGSTFTAWIQQD